MRNLGFIAYVIGYSSGTPARRNAGAFGYLALLAMLYLAGEAAYCIINGTSVPNVQLLDPVFEAVKGLGF